MPFLSPPIRAPLPEKLPVASKDGKFVTGIDGKLSTTLPLPPTIWDRFKISGYHGTLWPTPPLSVADFLDWSITSTWRSLPSDE